MENNGSSDFVSQPSFSGMPSVAPQSAPPESTMRKIFMGPNGIRAGWRLAMYTAITFGLEAAIFLPLMKLTHHQKNEQIKVLTPGTAFLYEILLFFVAVLGAVIMRRIEHEKWDHYGLPLGRAFRGEFWLGILAGFSALSLVMLCLWRMHVYTIDSLALHGAEIVKYGAIWAVVFLLVGLFEEFQMRGYSLYTLSSGIGFWPSAVILSIVFFVGHIHNSGEDWLGLLGVFLFGMFCCLTLWKTGSLWFAVGVHAAWDWGLTFFYSAPDSGLMAEGQLFKSHFTGPYWLSGGSAGPEGSVIVTILLLLCTLAVVLFLPKRKWVSQNELRLAKRPPEPVALLDASALRS
jgi:uncharacterized protein